jgi:hypothetical protein
MSKTKTAYSGRRKERSYEEFMAEHESEMDFLFAYNAGPHTLTSALTAPLRPPLPPVMVELKNHPFFRLLSAAKRENCPEAFGTNLYLWLCRMGITPPGGVFVEPPGAPGRPRDQRTAQIHDKWIELGEPSLGCQKLAHAVYGVQCTKANSAERKKMVDRCRRAVERRLAQLRPNPV